MDRRRFVWSLGAGAVSLTATDVFRVTAEAAAAAAQAPAGAAANLIRIGSNENPYGPAPSALDAVKMSAGGANR